MKLSTFFKITCVITLMSLTYVHMQMQIIDLAYRGNQKEKYIKKIKEQNEYINQHILKLKSASHLGVKMLTEESRMMFADPASIVQAKGSKASLKSMPSSLRAQADVHPNPIISLLPKATQAEAEINKW